MNDERCQATKVLERGTYTIHVRCNHDQGHSGGHDAGIATWRDSE